MKNPKALDETKVPYNGSSIISNVKSSGVSSSLAINIISKAWSSFVVNEASSDIGESLTCDGQYDLSTDSAGECPLYETQVTTTGTIIDYFDITPFNGPYSFTIQDADGNQMDFVVWPESSEYLAG